MENSKYEMMLMLFPDLGESKTTETLEEVKSLITSEGGELLNEDVWGIRDLAYRIKKQDHGFYVVLNFTLESKKVKELEAHLNIIQSLMRYLIIKLPENYELRSLEDFEKQHQERKKEREEQKEKEAEQRKKTAKKVIRKAKGEDKEEKKEDKKETPKDEEKSGKDEKQPKEDKKLDDVDEKLKSIIEDPDISL